MYLSTRQVMDRYGISKPTALKIMHKHGCKLGGEGNSHYRISEKKLEELEMKGELCR